MSGKQRENLLVVVIGPLSIKIDDDGMADREFRGGPPNEKHSLRKHFPKHYWKAAKEPGMVATAGWLPIRLIDDELESSSGRRQSLLLIAFLIA